MSAWWPLQRCAPELAAALQQALTDARRARVVALPHVADAGFPILARLLYRLAVEDGAWFPLVQAPDDLAEADHEEVLRVAAGGWIVFAGPRRAGLERRAEAAGGVRLVVPGEARVRADAAAVALLHRWDAHHAVATDPTLARIRRAVAAYARAGEVVRLAGPPGAGRRALVEWAHAHFSDAPLYTPESARGRTDGWLLVEDLSARSRAELGGLLARVRRTERAAAPPRAASRPSHPALASIVGADPALCATLEKAARHAPGPSPVLVLGETGTGKEPMARAIHAMSGRPGRLVTVDLASRAAALVADDLFGHAAGAYADARQPREGAFLQAHRGTVFLDEVGNLDLETQAKLLRVLESGEVQPLGSDRVHKADVRIVAATNADLHAMADAGTFRRDLLMRLSGVTLHLPPLRERPGDLRAIAESLLARLGRRPEDLTDEAVEALLRHDWPGNVRELLRALERAAGEAGDGPIRERHVDTGGGDHPIFVLTSEDEMPAALTRHEQLQLGALSVGVPPLRERGPRAVRAAVLARLAGRVVCSDALGWLEAWPWWGNHVELDRKLRALGAFEGRVDADLLAAAMPELATRPSVAPIRTMLHPAIAPDGSVVGLHGDHHDAAVLIGRLDRLPERPRDLRESELVAWVRAIVGDGTVACLPFPHLPWLSRAHALVVRGSTGLLVHVAPGALPVLVSPVGGSPAPVVPGVPAHLGSGGVVEVLRDGEPYLQVHAFLGSGALDDAAAWLRERASGPALVTKRLTSPKRRAWRLDATEIALLNGWVVEYVRSGRGQFEPFLRSAMEQAHDDPHASNLRHFLSEHGRKYCGRLYESAENAALRDDLYRRLSGSGLLEAARKVLPAGIADVLRSPRLTLSSPD